MKDIVFYTLDFERLYILPQYTVNKGYISANVQKDFNGVGSFEILFADEGLRKLIIQHRENLMFEWNGVQGILCAYRDDTGGFRVTGETLNGLLKRIVIPSTATTLNSDVETLARSAVGSAASWLTLGDAKGFEKAVSYSTDTYKSADVYISDLLKLDNAGYEIKADFTNKQFVFEVLKSNERNLILSTNNLNAYDFIETYINRTVAYGGYYPKKQDDTTVWTYITLDKELNGVYKKDVVLSAKTEEEALQELKSMIADTETEMKTRNVTYGVDYVLGDVVRVQNNDTAVRKRITSIVMSQENGYIENPIFSEVE